MHAPRPYGRFHAGALSPEDAAAAELLARSVSNLKGVSGFENFKRVRTLPSGREALAVDMGGTFRVIILEQDRPPVPAFDGLAHPHIPMLFSGAITRAEVLTDGQAVGIKLTDQCRRRLVEYDAAAALPAKDVALMRFRIEYAGAFAYFKPRFPGIYTSTQYVKLRPTWYSGAMTEVMQVVGGYGRLKFDALPDTPVERARLKIPAKWRRRIDEELSNRRLPGYAGVPDVEGQMRLDYRHQLCHGVGFDNEGAPWMIRVNARGVWVMPLPLVPATTTDAFREWMDEVGDDEMIVLLERFGGLPTGEPFPAEGQDFEAWRRAGVIIKVCDCADFYDHQALYAASGWGFNSRGTEAYNTCWQFINGLKHVHGYKMSLGLAAVADGGRLPTSWDLDDPQDAARLDAYLGSIYRTLDSSARSLAIKYKLRRFTGPELLARASAGGDGAAYWDGLEVDPIAAHEGRVTRVASGPVFWPRSIAAQAFGAIKFPELTGAGCESFDVTSPDYAGPEVRCDTVVFGCYVKDELRTAKYFRDTREVVKEVESDFEDLMIVGTWEKTETSGMTGLMGQVYTTDADDREEMATSTTHTKLIGTDLGYGEPLWRTPGLFMRTGTLLRARYYEHRWEVVTRGSYAIGAAVVVPVFARDSLGYAYEKSSSNNSQRTWTEMRSMRDPNSYQFWTEDTIWHYLDVTPAGNKGSPYPKEGAPVWLDTYKFDPFPGSDFADGGAWYGMPILDVTAIVGPYTSRNAVHNAGGAVIGGKAPGWQAFDAAEDTHSPATGRVHMTIRGPGATVVHRRQPEAWYFQFSPVEGAGEPLYFYRDACWNAIGRAEFASITEQDAFGNRTRWGQSVLSSAQRSQHFIGVINE